MGAAAERGLAVLARGAVGEWCVAVSVRGTAAFAVRVTAERGLAALTRDAVGERRVAVAVRGTAAFAMRGAPERGFAIFTRSAIGSLSRLMRDGRFRACCRLNRAYEFRGLRGGFLRVFSHGR